MISSTCRPETESPIPHGDPAPRRTERDGLHVGLIMDGNGRWANGRGLSRSDGHRAGASAVRRVTQAAPGLGIDLMTLYAFSSDNWKRPPQEVAFLMELLGSFLATETETCVEAGIRVSLVGRRDRLPETTLATVRFCEERTRECSGLHVRLAVDYSARDAMVTAAGRLRNHRKVSRAALASAIARAGHSDVVRDVDLVIRTGGEQRLSDFLLWESAYAELMFTPCPWPEFDGDHLAAAVREFRLRERRFGGLCEDSPRTAEETRR